MSKNIVIGVGNLLFNDDGVGVIAAHYLRKNFNYKPEIALLDGGTLGFNLTEYFLEYDNVFIIDTISTGDKAGTIYKIPSDKLLGVNSYKKTAHEVEVLQMLEACELHGKRAEVTIFAIAPQDINSVNIGLSKTLTDKFDVLIQTVIKEIESLGIEISRKSDVLVEEIIKELRC